ncbi:MAG: hypothetical protein ABIQ86_06015 [Steroidobacteraceae bacterium]
MTGKNQGGSSVQQGPARSQAPQENAPPAPDQEEKKSASAFEKLTATLGLLGLVLGIASVSRTFALSFATIVACVLVSPWLYRPIFDYFVRHPLQRHVILPIVFVVAGWASYKYLDSVARVKAVPHAPLEMNVRQVGPVWPAARIGLEAKFENIGEEIAHEAQYFIGVEKFETGSNTIANRRLALDFTNDFAKKAAEKALKDPNQSGRYKWEIGDIFPRAYRIATYPDQFNDDVLPASGWTFVIVGIVRWTDSSGRFESRQCRIIEAGISYECNVQRSTSVLWAAGS